jgi:hypothetical protein
MMSNSARATKLCIVGVGSKYKYIYGHRWLFAFLFQSTIGSARHKLITFVFGIPFGVEDGMFGFQTLEITRAYVIFFA